MRVRMLAAQFAEEAAVAEKREREIRVGRVLGEPRRTREARGTGDVVIARERIGVTADGLRAVPVEHPLSARLLAGEGCELSPEDVARFGLQDGVLPPDWELLLSGAEDGDGPDGAA